MQNSRTYRYRGEVYHIMKLTLSAPTVLECSSSWRQVFLTLAPNVQSVSSNARNILISESIILRLFSSESGFPLTVLQ